MCTLRVLRRSAALFYSDNATSETTYVSRNRQLSDLHQREPGRAERVHGERLPARYDVKVTGGYEFKQFKYKDFTDSRTGEPVFAQREHVLQIYVSANY